MARKDITLGGQPGFPNNGAPVEPLGDRVEFGRSRNLAAKDSRKEMATSRYSPGLNLGWQVGSDWEVGGPG